MNLVPKKIFQLPVIGDVLAYAYLGPRYILSKLLNPILFPLMGFRLIKRGTTAIWVPQNKEEIVKEGIGLLQLCDPDLFSLLTKQHLLISYIGNKSWGSPSNRVSFLEEVYIKWGAEGVAAFLAHSVWYSEEKVPFNLFKRKLNFSLSRKLLDWMCQHSFSPAMIKSYSKVVEQREWISKQEV